MTSAAQIIEESEDVNGDRMATVTPACRPGTTRNDLVVNVDKTVCAVANMLSEYEHEQSMGWSLCIGWYDDWFKKIKAASETTSDTP